MIVKNSEKMGNILRKNKMIYNQCYHLINFEKAISDFYNQLLEKQEPLDENFEKLLHENLWNLYET